MFQRYDPARTDAIKALTLAHVAHAGQKYGNGESYFHAHLAKVAARVEKNLRDAGVTDEVLIQKAVTAAWLHDIIEDTQVTEQFLRDFGFSEEIIQAVVALTKRPEDKKDYEGYLIRVRANELARLVKIADLQCNLATIAAKPHNEAKYRMALAFLQG